MTVVHEAIAAALAELEPERNAPTAPFGYGADISCVADLAEDMGEVSGRRALAEALVRAITTPRGSLADALERGIDLRSYLNRGVTRDELLSIEGTVRAEWRKDDRVAAVDVTVTFSANTKTLRGRGRITPVAGDGFDLVFALTDAGVAIEEIYG